MRGPAAETAAGDRQQRVLAAQVLPVGGQIEAPPMLDPEPADITVMARIHPRPGFIFLPVDEYFGNAFAKHPIRADRGGIDVLDHHRRIDRQSVVEGKSVSVRVDLGCSRIIKKKKQTYEEIQNN